MNQTNLLKEIIVDNFAGGGGASTGIELATGRIVDIAINHDSDAILMHQTNHPYTTHYQADVYEIDPIEVCHGKKVGLAWFSPDCKHFSKAKGGKPVSKKIRGLAWIVLRWAAKVRPRVIILENVEEFQTWGPVRKGKPVKKLAGTTYHRWLEQLSALGYKIEYRELRACDYGAPTIRKRFFLVARCDGKLIQWPKPTHGNPESPAVQSDQLKPWRTAAEIIDWNLPSSSIFERKKELAVNTQKRIAKGVQKFVLNNASPFIVQVNHSGDNFRGQSIDCPLSTVTAKHGYGMVAPNLIQYHSETSCKEVRGQSIKEPIMTVDSSPRYGLAATYLSEYFGNAQNGISCSEPLHTVTSKDREAVTFAFLSKFYKTGIGQRADEPLHTVTTSAGHFGTVIVKCSRNMHNLGNWPKVRDLLNKYAGYQLTEDDILLIYLDGKAWYICDIGLRMLTPRELYRAQGVPDDYIIDHDYTGHTYAKSKQVARCGNMVCPPLAEALVTANVPELCERRCNNMAEINNNIAV